MSKLLGLKCKECGKETPIEPIHVCEFCFGPMEVSYDYPEIKKIISRKKIESGPASQWRYIDLLPVNGEPTVGLNAGFTPLVHAKNLGRMLDIDNLYIKNDTVNHPTLSFKDRVVAVALTKAKEFGFKTVACASTGNLANSVAAHAAAAGLECYVFIPHDLEAGKILGNLVFNPTVVAVDGTYDDVNRLCSEIAGEYNWAFVNINVRPYYSEGSKTLAYEVIEQLGWKAPDQVVIPIASGSMLTKIYKGINEFTNLGLIDSSHTVINGAQADGCSPVAKSFKNKKDFVIPEKPNTIAKSLAIGNPADGVYALDIIKKTSGTCESSSDQEIIDGIKLLAETEGIFAETAGGVTIANLKKMRSQGKIKKQDLTVAFITGNGLKTQEAVAGFIGKPVHIKPNLNIFQEKFNL